MFIFIVVDKIELYCEFVFFFSEDDWFWVFYFLIYLLFYLLIVISLGV